MLQQLVDQGMLTENQRANLKNGKQIIEAVELLGDTAAFGLEPEQARSVVDQYLAHKDPRQGLDAARQVVVQVGLGLPEDSIDAGLNAEELLDLAGGAHAIGGADLLGNAEVWQAVKQGGTDGGMLAIHKGVYDFPEEAYSSGRFADVIDGQEAAAKLNADTSNPKYWTDYRRVASGELSTADFVNRHGNVQRGGGAETTPPAQTNPSNETPANSGNAAGDTPQGTPPADPGKTTDQTSPPPRAPVENSPREPANSETQPTAPPQAETSGSPPPSQQNRRSQGPAPEAAPDVAPPEKTIVSAEAVEETGHNIVLYLVTWSDGSQDFVHRNTQTGEVLQVIPTNPGNAIEVGDEMTAEFQPGGQSGGDSESSSGDDRSDDSSNQGGDDDDSDNESETEEEAEDDTEEAEDESDEDTEQEEEAADEEADADAEDQSEADDGEEAGESTPADPDELSEAQKKALIEAMKANEVFRKTVLGQRMFDADSGSADSTPNPMRDLVVVQTPIDPAVARQVVWKLVGQPAEPGASPLPVSEEVQRELASRNVPGAGVIDYGPDHVGGNQDQGGFDPGMQSETGRGTLEGDDNTPLPSPTTEDNDDDDDDDDGNGNGNGNGNVGDGA